MYKYLRIQKYLYLSNKAIEQQTNKYQSNQFNVIGQEEKIECANIEDCNKLFVENEDNII
jgi:hypothetical protein